MLHFLHMKKTLTILGLLVAALVVVIIVVTTHSKTRPAPPVSEVSMADRLIPDQDLELGLATEELAIIGSTGVLVDLVDEGADLEPTAQVREVVRADNRGKFRNFTTDLTATSVDLDQILNGGPGKDGIPALTNPVFTSIREAGRQGMEDGDLGIVVEGSTETRFYPHRYLVWHEIVNDDFDGMQVAVTFCPLCGSAIVFDRHVEGQLLDFGVSGLLYESNMVMYDRQTDTLWSQSRGEGIVGHYLDTKLTHVPTRVLTFAELAEHHPDAQVISKDTPRLRNLGRTPYGNYDENEDIFFPISVRDNRFPTKELFYVVPFKDTSIAFRQEELADDASSTQAFFGESLTASIEGGSPVVRDASGQELPGYFEMWFSWAIHHQDGEVWVP